MRRVINYIGVLLVVLLVFFACEVKEDEGTGPHVILTAHAVNEIRDKQNSLPLLGSSINKLQAKVDADLQNGIVVPVPKDPGGGYTHNRHKQNYITMQGAGILWQLTGDSKYYNYVKDMLVKYAFLYPTLPEHPVKASYAPGKLFWQQLNEAVWLVYVSQAYDCVRDNLSDNEKEVIEKNLLIPYANFLSVENHRVFNRVHNHGVWAAAAVGMTGFALDNEELVNRAFYGVETGPKPEVGSGFLVHLDELFSPDGYYTEGPYYQRYALLPYMLFAQAIENNMPELKIFEYRDGILQKAVMTTLQLTNTDGRFIPFNDALKSMSFKATELVHAVDIVYGEYPENKELLSVAMAQQEVIICQAGLEVAKAVHKKEAQAFKWKSVEFKDGPDGLQGAVGILRSNTGMESQMVTMKYASQGMGHGHFDRLTIQLYDRGEEILQDYGAARFVNVEYKHGGRYLPENKTWARQTIAHNTLVVDEESQSEGNVKIASSHSSDPWLFDASNTEVQIMSAKENNAYKGVDMHRTIAMLNIPELSEQAIILDLFRTTSNHKHKYQLPYYYLGHMMNTTVDLKSNSSQVSSLGKSFGFQHLWNRGEGSLSEGLNKFVWLKDECFYTLNMQGVKGDKLIMTQIGANDPEFNLRNEPGVLLERLEADNTLFVSVIETHGSKHPVTEIVKGLKGAVTAINTIYNNQDYSIVEVVFTNDEKVSLAICNSDNKTNSKHQLSVADKDYQWVGVYHLFKNK